MKGYDLVAINPDKKISVRVQVKSRWRTKANGFIINNFDCDFVVIVLLNRGEKGSKVEALPPAYYVVPVEDVLALPRNKDWGKVRFSQFPDFQSYRDRWDLIRETLKMSGEL